MSSKDDFQSEISKYRLLIHINGVSSIFTTVLSVYMILYRSTPQMVRYKWYLLNIVFWSTFLDLYLSFFYTPQILFPALGMCTQGWLSVFNNMPFKRFQYVRFYKLLPHLNLGVAYLDHRRTFRLDCLRFHLSFGCDNPVS
jgi:hypothetical protein